MKFLIDGHRDRVALRSAQWPEGVAGQLLTPLTRYRRGHEVFAIDNGCFTSFREQNFKALLKREQAVRDQSLFVCVPDKVGSHKETMSLWEQHNHLADGYKKAFVAQEGYEGFPEGVDALFIGGTNVFKDSKESQDAVRDALRQGLHVHIGRVNGPDRFIRFHLLGAHTCDGSGVSRYDHMLPVIRVAVENLK